MGLALVERVGVLAALFTWSTRWFVPGAVVLAVVALAHRALRLYLRTSATAAVLSSIVDCSAADGAAVHADSLALVESAHNAARALVDVAIPAIADAVAAVAGVALIASANPTIAIPLAVLALVTVAVSAAWLMTRSTDKVFERYLEMIAQVTDAFDGRTELLASGSADVFAGRARAAIDDWRTMTLRADRGSALGSRLPMFVAVATGVTLVALHGVDLHQVVALLVVASICMGFVRGAYELSKTPARVAGLVQVHDATQRVAKAVGGLTPECTSLSWSEVTVVAGDRTILDRVSFEVHAGEVVALAGPNGAGKTTLIHVALGLRAIDKGRFQVGEMDLQRADVNVWRRAVRYVPQRPYLLPRRQVREAMDFPPRGAHEPEIIAALRRVDLIDRWGAPQELLSAATDRLSAGERQRLSLARALLSEADVYLLDEPDANLDARGIAWLASLLRELAAAGKIVVVAAHSAEILDAATRIISLERGRVTSSDVRAKPLVRNSGG